jgi:hypothetical protein
MNEIVNMLIEHSAEFAIIDPALRGATAGGLALAKDWIGPERLKTVQDVFERAAEKLKRRGAKAQTPPLTIMIPLLEAAQDEGRAELRDIWASLLAAAADPARLGIFRRDFIDIAKQLEPVDAASLNLIQKMTGSHQPSRVAFVAGQLSISTDQVLISFYKLRDLKLVTGFQPDEHHPELDTLGRLFMKIIAD